MAQPEQKMGVVKQKRTHYAVVYSTKDKKDITYIPFYADPNMSTRELADRIIDGKCALTKEGVDGN